MAAALTCGYATSKKIFNLYEDTSDRFLELGIVRRDLKR